MRIKNTFPLRKAPFVLLAIFTALMIAGVNVDEPGRVLEQAKIICLACIGLG